MLNRLGNLEHLLDLRDPYARKRLVRHIEFAYRDVTQFARSFFAEHHSDNNLEEEDPPTLYLSPPEDVETVPILQRFPDSTYFGHQRVLFLFRRVEDEEFFEEESAQDRELFQMYQGYALENTGCSPSP